VKKRKKKGKSNPLKKPSETAKYLPAAQTILTRSDIEGRKTGMSSGTEGYFFQIDFDEVFQVEIELFGTELVQKFRLGGLVDFHDAIDYFVLTHPCNSNSVSLSG
jgi:hypothetical protein